MWELPNVEGHLTKEQVEELFPKSIIQRKEDGKHMFSHIEWRLWCYEIRLREALSLPVMLEQDSKVFTRKEIKEQISIPSAFDCCKKYMEE